MTLDAAPVPGTLPALLTIHDIASLFQVRRTAAYARTHDPDFPDPLVISGSCYRWYATEVLAYLESRRMAKKVYVDRTASLRQGLPVDLREARLSKRPRVK